MCHDLKYTESCWDLLSLSRFVRKSSEYCILQFGQVLEITDFMHNYIKVLLQHTHNICTSYIDTMHGHPGNVVIKQFLLK